MQPGQNQAYRITNACVYNEIDQQSQYLPIFSYPISIFLHSYPTVLPYVFYIKDQLRGNISKLSSFFNSYPNFYAQTKNADFGKRKCTKKLIFKCIRGTAYPFLKQWNAVAWIWCTLTPPFLLKRCIDWPPEIGKPSKRFVPPSIPMK